MSILQIFVFFNIAILAFFVLACHIRRARARAKTDKIIAGEVEANSIEINRCIRILTSTNAWLTSRAFQDDDRIKRLRDIQKRLIRQHTSIFQKSPLR